ncbi:YciI family protein [Streptosporangium longisporum]|uniref:YciI family protein n=1 Tax=Streptosporangium longisporum TaxID=46187 RepID=A0ABP6KF42_9ACTN
MKFVLNMHMNPAVWESLTEDERNEVMNGHSTFMETVTASGEMIMTQALADPSQSAVVRVRGGRPVVTDGPYLEAKEYLGGFYLIDCETRERAFELAALIPDAKVEGMGIEVRPVMFSAGRLDV